MAMNQGLYIHVSLDNMFNAQNSIDALVSPAKMFFNYNDSLRTPFTPTFPLPNEQQLQTLLQSGTPSRFHFQLQNGDSTHMHAPAGQPSHIASTNNYDEVISTLEYLNNIPLPVSDEPLFEPSSSPTLSSCDDISMEPPAMAEVTAVTATAGYNNYSPYYAQNDRLSSMPMQFNAAPVTVTPTTAAMQMYPQQPAQFMQPQFQFNPQNITFELNSQFMPAPPPQEPSNLEIFRANAEDPLLPSLDSLHVPKIGLPPKISSNLHVKCEKASHSPAMPLVPLKPRAEAEKALEPQRRVMQALKLSPYQKRFVGDYHYRAEALSLSSAKSHKCPVPGCRVRKQKIGELVFHVQFHKNYKKHCMPYSCGHKSCPWHEFGFSSRHVMFRHMQTVHTSARQFSCEKCGKEFKRRDGMLRHCANNSCSKKDIDAMDVEESEADKMRTTIEKALSRCVMSL